ncbi:MAG TPA: hypothetical protein VFW99_02070 [Candidatus Nitrosotalea sp.]|nr:hypothetical protein [Candidatus Nitrosotalea sp.]
MVSIFKVLIGLALLIIGFVLLVSGVNTTTLQITNLYEAGIGVILMIGGVVVLAKS